MVKSVQKLENRVLETLQFEKNGLKLTELAGKLNLNSADPAVRRSLQRLLKKLIKNKLVIPSGNARARFYSFTKKNKVAQTQNRKSKASAKTSLLNEISLSPRSKRLFKYINQPITKRTPVGYNKSFLISYIPNKTFYLTEKQKEELLSYGLVGTKTQLAGTYAREIFSRLTIDLSWNSSRLEGNTYSLLETRRLIEFGEAAEGKRANEAQMILNHKSAIEFMINSSDEINFNRMTICNLHALLSDNLLGDPSASGRLRERAVEISGSVYIPIDNPHLLKQYFEMFLKKAKAIKNPFEQSFFALVHLSYLQSFEDVNKRTSRLAANISLIKYNMRPLAFVDVDQDVYLKALLGIYEQNDISLFKDLFIWAYKRSTQRYSAIQQSFGEPNLLKLKHRVVVKKIIQDIVKNKIPGQQVSKYLSMAVKKLVLPVDDSRKLLEILDLEIASLHEGNIARYQILPGEYKLWVALKK